MDSMSSCNPTVGGAAATTQLSPVRRNKASQRPDRLVRRIPGEVGAGKTT